MLGPSSWHGNCFSLGMVQKPIYLPPAGVLFFLFAAAYLYPVDKYPVDESRPVEARITLQSELYASETLRNRISLDYSEARLVLVEKQGNGSPASFTLGFSSPVLTFGPLSRFGLLKSLFNPLGYYPGSSVFAEPTGLRLNAAFETGSRRGAVLEPLPGNLGLFLLKSSRAPLKTGGFFTLEEKNLEGSSFRLEGITVYSHPERAGWGDAWFKEEAPYPGGNLLHLGGSFSLRHSGWHLHLSSAASSGERAAPGAFTQLELGYAQRQILLALLFGLCGREYFTPDGKHPKNWLLAGGKVSITFHELYTFTGSYRKEVARPEIRMQPEQYLESRDELGVLGEAAFPLSRKARIVLSGRWERTASFSVSGNRDFTDEPGLALSLSAGAIDFKAEWRQEIDNSKLVENSFLIGSSLLLDRIRLSGEAELFTEPEPACLFSFKFDLRPGDYHLYLRARTEIADSPFTPDSISVTLGWEVKSRLSVSD